MKTTLTIITTTITTTKTTTYDIYFRNNMIGIYKITSPSGRIYIGQSWNIKKRLNAYKTLYASKKQRLLNRSFVKYGYENHKFQIIKVLDIKL